MLELHLKAHKIPFDRECCLIEGRKWRWDFLCAGTLAVEVQGQIWAKGGHTTGAGLTRDYQKANAVTVAGYRPLFFSTQMVESGEAIATIRAALGFG